MKTPFALIALVAVVACSTGDVTAPTHSFGDEAVVVKPTLSVDRAVVDVKLSTDRRGAQWTTPTLRFTRGSAQVGVVKIAFTPAGKCGGAGGVMARADTIQTRGDTSFVFPMALCIVQGTTDTLYNAGSFVLSAKTIIGADTLTASFTVDVACKASCTPLAAKTQP